jgi:nitrogen fixation/metabolism regulation signal transduction histidine kinase
VLSIRPTRILYRIVLPFTLLFVITTALSWLISAYFITRNLDNSLENQMAQVARIISRSSYVLNPAILRQVKEVVNAEIVLFDQDGRIVSGTFSDPALQDKLITFFKACSEDSSAAKEMKLGNTRYRTILHPLVLPKRGGAFLSIWMPTHTAERLKSKIILVIGGIALFGILGMAVVGYLIARTITAPVEELVQVTEKIAGGSLNERVSVESQDEIGSLAHSFNHMIDQLMSFERRLVESEKLATAGQMAAGLAHEIRNPLTSIKMLGQVLQGRMKDQPEDQQTLNALVKEVDRLDRIIQEFINRARPGELSLAEGDVNQEVNEVLSVAAESLAAQNIVVQRNLSDHMPTILMDREKTKQVLWNLVLNAKEAMPKGGNLMVSTQVADNKFVEILVEDSGHGIAGGEPERLFQPFFTTKPEGVGLGLTMSRKIVEKQGGELSLANSPQGGMRARVLLPTKGS